MKVFGKAGDQEFLVTISSYELAALGLKYGSVSIGEEIDLSSGIQAANLLRQVDLKQLTQQIDMAYDTIDSLNQIKTAISKFTMFEKLSVKSKDLENFTDVSGHDDSDDIPF